ncbi:MAG: NADH:ubiquinone reductase (Na(+)-transporting) subunit A, partial [Saprospiraceae bacterium]|nr:NADH:ubiquinone reductase (Na(+)-transporting) subunit A [Saprospiraceae bacterium]
EDVPKAIFVSCFDSAPLAPDLNFVIESDKENFQTGLHVLQTLAQGNLHVCLQKGSQETLAGLTNQLPDTNKHQISGPHPAGNVGIQIHHILPIQHKNDIVWYVNPQDVLIIGRLFAEGKYRAERLVALTGSSVSKPSYMRMISGQKLASVLDQALNTDHVRVIQGNVLSGKKSSQGDFLSFYVNQLTVIPEGDQPEFLGWLLPGFHKLSLSRTYFSWLSPNRKYNLDTNMHGELRAFVMTGQYDRVLPMNIYPVILLKAILAGDIEKMEALGIYEIAEEDFALCEFVCTSKIPVQNIVTQGLTLAREEG